ncbi:MAG: hypothetical protein ABGY11_01520, partial [Candidatus Thioglobus sp.]
MELRTQQQFEEIITTNHNGNLTKSYELAEEYGFYASDLREFYTREYYWFNVTNLISIAEGAMMVRLVQEQENSKMDRDAYIYQLNEL